MDYSPCPYEPVGYDAGGPVPTGTTVVNGTGKPEPMLTESQLTELWALQGPHWTIADQVKRLREKYGERPDDGA